MWIFTAAERFRPENFVITDFYGQETCFAWQNRSLVVFPYVGSTNSTSKLPVIVAPREIKCIRSFDSRVFVVCKPMGVYKLKDTLKFALLSQTGVGMGPFYYQVLCVEDQWLYMKDKSTKNNRQLFRLHSNSDGSHNICEIALSPGNSDESLRRGLQQLETGDAEDVCVVANNRKIFAVTSNDVQLIHRCEQEIIDIVAIFRRETTILGFVLVAKNSAVLVYTSNEKLVFDKVYLDSEVCGLCAGIGETSNDVIWTAHTDQECVYYSSKTISADTFRRTGMDKKRLLAIKNYKNKTLIGLSDKQLLEIEIQTTGLGVPDSDEFFKLKPEMLKGSEAIVDEICDKAKELQLLNESLLREQEKLRRINIYAHKQAIFFLPNVRVERMAGQLFLRVKFDNVLPNNCHIVVALKSGQRTTYCMKLVEDSEVVVDVPVEAHILDNSLELSVDLVTLPNESQPWCLIRNYTKRPSGKYTGLQNDRTRFLTAKLAALRNLTAEGNLDMKKLAVIKKSIRRELSDP